MIGRRQLLLDTGAIVLGVMISLCAQAQPTGKMHRVGILGLGNTRVDDPDIAAFRDRLGQLGYVDGQNLRIEIRSATGGPIGFLRLLWNWLNSTLTLS